jgi:NAD(P)-dependent dehydrogenase (short-subunit alcohol dehydrogenase family)
MDDRFTDQVAIVTGGARGIGEAVARRLASEGAVVVLFDRLADEVNEAACRMSADGMPVESMAVDITDEDSVKTSIAEVVAQHGKLDVMVNCAGIVGPNNTKITEYETAAFDEIYAVNLRGSFLMTKFAIEPMLAQDYGRILLYASIGGKEGNPGMVGYAATKAGVFGLVKGVGKEYAETGVTVNGIAPAVIRTPMVDAADPEMVKYMTDRIPMKRTGSLEEAAAMSAFIVSRENSFSTGYVFDLSGGRATY